MARCSVPQIPTPIVLPEHVAGAARRFREDRQRTVSELIGTDDPMMIEFFLLLNGYLTGFEKQERGDD